MIRKIGLNKAQKFLLPFAAMVIGISSVSAAQDKAKEEALTKPPAIYTNLIACKDISDSGRRLSCYDEKVAALETAQTSKQVVIADREQVREARKGLFGLSLPRIKLFGGDKDEGGQIEQIESNIKSARMVRGGKWLIKLEDGAVWRQTDPARSTMRRPKTGDPIVIKRGSLGSFVAKVKGGRGFKVKRTVN